MCSWSGPRALYGFISVTVSDSPRVVVAGDGVIGLATAIHLAARSVAVTLLAPNFHGAASPASAGMLAPSVERAQGAAQAFADSARDAWPRLARLVEESGGGTFEIQRNGILQVARSETDAGALRSRRREGDEWIAASDARRLEPALGAIAGAVLHPGDGVVDAPAAMSALRRAVGNRREIRVESMPAAGVRFSASGVVCDLKGGKTVEADLLVVAAGSWTSAIAGLPRRVPIAPLRGALVAVEPRLVRIPVYEAGGHSYVFPRGPRTVIGATSDNVGFASEPAATDASRLVEAAAAFIPALASATTTPAWGGLRPMTPDGLALIGLDPAEPRCVWAAGHGRNGFLQAALTAEVVSALALGEVPRFDLSPFEPSRF